MIFIEDINIWSGQSTGRFHLDFLGVKTSPKFWSGIKPARAGHVQVGLPTLSEFYLEYAALVMAATFTRSSRSFQVVEVGASWGLWTARAIGLARYLNLPVRSVAVEPMPAHVAKLQQHYLANGANPQCNLVERCVIGDRPGLSWLRFNDDGDLSARVVTEDWVNANALVPLTNLPAGVRLPCRDKSQVMLVDQKCFRDIAPANAPIHFLHLRVGPGPDRVLNSPGLNAARLGVVVVPSINPIDDPKVEKSLGTLGLTEVLHLPNGFVLRTPRGDTTLRGALRICTGELVSKHEAVEMADRLMSTAQNGGAPR